MLYDLEQFVLYHPRQVDLRKYPRCAITHLALPPEVAEYKDPPGHEQVWELIVPLFPELDDVIQVESDGAIVIDGPVIRMFFYSWTYTAETAPEIIGKVKAAREKIFLSLARQCVPPGF